MKPASPAVCGLLLPLLAERGCLPPDKLWELANHASDDVAVPAAHALAWTPGSHDSPMLLGQVAKARTARRANALLFAAVGLGSKRPSTRYGTVCARATGSDGQLLDAVAVAGDRADAVLLLELALQPEVDEVHAVLAAAHLGNVETLPMLAALSEVVAPEILREAVREITGFTAPTTNDGTSMNPSIRVLRGQPWSLAGLIECLAAGNEPLHAQRRLALELRVRTGQVLPVAFSPLAKGGARASMLSGLQNHFAKTSGRLKPGAWYYQGKPSPGRGAPS